MPVSTAAHATAVSATSATAKTKSATAVTPVMPFEERVAAGVAATDGGPSAGAGPPTETPRSGEAAAEASTKPAIRYARNVLCRPTHGGWFGMVFDMVLIFLVIVVTSFKYSAQLSMVAAKVMALGAGSGSTSRFDLIKDSGTLYSWLIQVAADSNTMLTSVRSPGGYTDPNYVLNDHTPLFPINHIGRVSQLRRKRQALCDSPLMTNAGADSITPNVIAQLGINCSEGGVPPYGGSFEIDPNWSPPSTGSSGGGGGGGGGRGGGGSGSRSQGSARPSAADLVVVPSCLHHIANFTTYSWAGEINQDPFKPVSEARLAKQDNPLLDEFLGNEDTHFVSQFTLGIDHVDEGAVQHFFEALTKCGWIDTRTEVVEYDQLFFAPNFIGLAILTQRFEFTSFGTVRKKITSYKAVTLKVAANDILTEQEGVFYNFDIFLESVVLPGILGVRMFWVFGALGEDLVRMFRSKKSDTVWKRLRHIASPAFAFDTFFLVVYLTMLHASRSAEDKNEVAYQKMAEMGEGTHAAGGGPYFGGWDPWRRTWSNSMRPFVRSVRATVDASNYQKEVQIVFLTVLVLELMRHFTVNPHFAIVPRSLTYAIKDILLLAIVLTFLILAYGGILASEFGTTVPQFSTLEGTLVVVVTMTLGDWGGWVEELFAAATQPYKFFAIFVAYNIVVVTVTMNVFLSIVLDAYSTMKQQIAQEESELAAAQEVRKEARHLRKERTRELKRRRTQERREHRLHPEAGVVRIEQKF